MNFTFVDPWHLFLPREAGHVISLMGSGGKTTLMRIMAEVLRAEGIPVVLTTTTRSEPLADLPTVLYEDLLSVDHLGLPDVFFVHAGTAEEDKWAGLSPEEVDELGGLLPDRVVLAEVDGAAKLPLKLHREDEPIWPGRTSLGIVVMGAGAVGSKTGEVLHRFGRIPGPLPGDLQDWTVWEWDHSLTLLQKGGGYLDRVPAGVPCVLALTGMEAQPDSIGLFDFVGRAMEDGRLPLTLFCDLSAEPPGIRTACNETEESR